MMTRKIVSVCITTYNKEKYVERTLLSALNQTTDFGYEIIVSDDNSKDNTVAVIENIIKTHPKGNIIKLYKQPKNLTVNPNMLFVFSKCSGRYIAMLDGDDQWIDEKKLQKQLDFLEKNQDFSAVGTDSHIVYLDSGKTENFSNFPGKELSINDLLEIRYFQTSTFFFKKSMLQDDFPVDINANDRCLFLLAGCFGKVKVLEDITCNHFKYDDSLSVNLKYEDVKSDFNMYPFITKLSNKINKIEFKRYLYYTLMTYPSILSKADFHKASRGYFLYNVLSKFSFNPLKLFSAIKWSRYTINQKYQIKVKNKSFI
ncbi:glycosyltransferase family 2 protein [uncultured Chryseobacterium sp.]|uniref:glycosyltransferase family 2 protein n=1 Tax=uncultured Chryseobacterium sp. TaxID=259322 RepID=UPI0025CECBA8|nr:glycosyltransferase family 2 protein [uncultured Chryseobacterium sp.]